jgi:hypothetical protein
VYFLVFYFLLTFFSVYFILITYELICCRECWFWKRF